MGRKRETTKEDIESGYLTCKKCNQRRELIFFHKTRYSYKSNEIAYQRSKCKVCKSKNGAYKVKNKEVLDISNFTLSNEAKLFIEKIIKMKGYIDIIDAYKLAHYHLQVFDHKERLFDSVEQELSIMYKELLKVYDKDNKTKL